jgi:hypothetical protein
MHLFRVVVHRHDSRRAARSYCVAVPLRCLVFLAATLGTLACGGPTGPSSKPTIYTAPLTGQLVVTTSIAGPHVASTCAATTAISGTLKLTLEQDSAGTVSGRWLVSGPQTETANGGPTCTNPVHGSSSIDQGGAVTGPREGFSWTAQISDTGTSRQATGASSTVTSTRTWSFSGALSGSVVTGTMTYSETSRGTATDMDGGFAATISGSGTTTFPVSLR